MDIVQNIIQKIGPASLRYRTADFKGHKGLIKDVRPVLIAKVYYLM